MGALLSDAKQIVAMPMSLEAVALLYGVWRSWSS